MLIPLGILASSGGGAAGSFDLISTTLLSASQASVTFDVSTLASTYKHLQVRYTARQSNSGSVGVNMRLNSDTAGNYSMHALYGYAGSVSSNASTGTTYMGAGSAFGTGAAANAFSAAVVDLLDPFSTSKNKTIRTLEGRASEWIALGSGNWRSTNAVTTILLYPDVYSFTSGSRFSLYGIKG